MKSEVMMIFFFRSGRTFGKKFNNGGHDSKEDDHKSSQQNGRRGEEKSGTGRRNGRRLDIDDNVDFKQNEIDEVIIYSKKNVVFFYQY